MCAALDEEMATWARPHCPDRVVGGGRLKARSHEPRGGERLPPGAGGGGRLAAGVALQVISSWAVRAVMRHQGSKEESRQILNKKVRFFL